MSKCPKCQKRKGRRHCPALIAEICSRCCGEHRLRSISCPPDCTYLEGESYQSDRRHEKSRTRGKKFLDDLGGLLSGENDFNFALMLHADIHLFATEAGPVDDGAILRALENLKGMLSPVYVPGGESDPLTAYLRDRVENSRRYAISPLFGQRDRRRVLDELIRHLRNATTDDSSSYHDELTRFFGPMDLAQDFGFWEEDLAALRGDVGPDDRHGAGPRRSASGLILPG